MLGFCGMIHGQTNEPMEVTMQGVVVIERDGQIDIRLTECGSRAETAAVLRAEHVRCLAIRSLDAKMTTLSDLLQWAFTLGREVERDCADAPRCGAGCLRLRLRERCGSADAGPAG